MAEPRAYRAPNRRTGETADRLREENRRNNSANARASFSGRRHKTGGGQKMKFL